MHRSLPKRFEHPWTVGLALIMGVANLGLWIPHPVFESILNCLQFDRAAILDGEVWRLVTGNLVHWSIEHFLLDVAAFALLGWLYEPAILRRSENSSRPAKHLLNMSTMLLSTSCGVGLTVLTFQPEMMLYRGLSGVDSGLFAFALMLEWSEARNDVSRWWYVVPAAVVFITKLIFEVATGGLFFGTESLGDLGQPVPLAHLSGAVFASVCFIAQTIERRKHSGTKPLQNAARSTMIATG